MLFLVLLPMIPAMWLIATKSLEDALLDVYLPVLILVPMYYEFTVPHVINIGAATATLFPILIVALVRHHDRWRFQRSDLWMGLFLVGLGISNSAGGPTIGIRAFFETIFLILFPYAVGKLLIEQPGLRERFIRRLCWLLAVVAVLSIVEFRLGKNLFSSFYVLLFREAPMEQLRGFTRVQGPYGHAIIAGTVFTMGWILAVWLRYLDKQKLGAGERKILGIPLSMVLVGLTFLGLILTNSRGPWIGAALAFAISRIGPAKRVRRTAVLVVLCCSVAGIAGYQYSEAYTDPNLYGTAGQDQQNAIYRRMLLDSYEPVVRVGGVFGWGIGFPRVGGQTSIDNEYLWLRLTQGPFGLWLFVLISLESIAFLISSARRSQLKTDFYFCVTMLALLCGVLVIGTTVEIYNQAYALFFLCIGWSLSVRPTEASAEAAQLPAAANASYPRIFA
jgi:hypothetical protein